MCRQRVATSHSLPPSLSPPLPSQQKEHFYYFFLAYCTLIYYSQLHLRLLKYLHANDLLNGSSLKLVWNSKQQFSTNCFSIARLLLDHPSLTIHPVSSEICTCKEPAQSRSLALALTRLQAKKRYANDHATTSRSPCYSGTRQGLAMRARGGIIESGLCFSSFIIHTRLQDTRGGSSNTRIVCYCAHAKHLLSFAGAPRPSRAVACR